MIKAKLYRGPMHGKNFVVRDEQYEILVAHRNNKNYSFVSVNPVMYEPKPLFDTLVYRRTRHTHPSGAIFYVYVQ